MRLNDKPRERAISLGNAIKKWARVNNYHILRRLADELKVDYTTWDDILRGRRFVESRYPDFYARLYRLTGLREADPTNLPEKDNHQPRKWSLDQLVGWWQKRYPEEFYSESVQYLIAKTQAGKDARYEPLLTTGNESQLLLEAENFLSLQLYISADERAIFCVNNRATIQRLMSVLSILGQPKQSREQLVNLMEVMNG